MLKNSFEELRNKFCGFYEAVKTGHETSTRSHRGHGLDHDVTVAQIAVMISPDEHAGEKAWCSAMLHSTDRLFEKGEDVKVRQHMRDCLYRLPTDYFTDEEITDILESAIRHAELNQDDQSLVQQIIMDADRLANLMSTVVIRAGQFRSNIPALEFRFLTGEPNPKSTYHSPCSALDDLRFNILEYIPQIRLEKAKTLAQKYTGVLHAIIENIEDTHRDLGLVGIEL